MRRLRFAALLLAAVSAAFPLPLCGQKPSCSVVGTLILRPLKSRVFKNSRMLRVWLPPGYDNPGERQRRYPVLYLNDGQNLFDACTSTFGPDEWRVDETATALIRSGKIPPLIIVGIDNAGKRDRAKEYLPYPDETLSPPTLDVNGRDYPRFLLDEVMPLINREFRTDTSPASTGIGGSSYGAGIALYTVMKLPGRFGRVLLESPSLYAHDDFLLREAERCKRWPAILYVGVGSVREPVEDVRRLKEILLREGLGDSRLLVVDETGAAHDEEAWARRFPRALQFLYSTEH
jgi:enterochelin esterase-like enzyme